MTTNLKIHLKLFKMILNGFFNVKLYFYGQCRKNDQEICILLKCHESDIFFAFIIY